MPGAKSGPVPIIRMFGITMAGNSVLCHIHGFTPYLYVPAPPDFKDEHCVNFRDSLNKAVIADMRNNKDNVTEAVLAVDKVIKESKFVFARDAFTCDMDLDWQIIIHSYTPAGDH